MRNLNNDKKESTRPTDRGEGDKSRGWTGENKEGIAKDSRVTPFEGETFRTGHSLRREVHLMRKQSGGRGAKGRREEGQEELRTAQRKETEIAS